MLPSTVAVVAAAVQQDALHVSYPWLLRVLLPRCSGTIRTTATLICCFFAASVQRDDLHVSTSSICYPRLLRLVLWEGAVISRHLLTRAVANTLCTWDEHRVISWQTQTVGKARAQISRERVSVLRAGALLSHC
eukprot:365257-Chlamydomonas_euryale.AAC.11